MMARFVSIYSRINGVPFTTSRLSSPQFNRFFQTQIQPRPPTQRPRASTVKIAGNTIVESEKLWNRAGKMRAMLTRLRRERMKRKIAPACPPLDKVGDKSKRSDGHDTCLGALDSRALHGPCLRAECYHYSSHRTAAKRGRGHIGVRIACA